VNDKSLIVDDIQSATRSETADMFGAKAAVGQMSVTCVTGTSVLEALLHRHLTRSFRRSADWVGIASQ
jgi:hypothetical protein